MKARLPKGVGGGPANMQSMIKQAQKMQADMELLQEELNAKEYDIAAGGGAVTIKINGKKEVISIKLSEEIVDPDDTETLEDTLVAAVNQAIKTVEETNSEAMNKIAGNISMPGLF